MESFRENKIFGETFCRYLMSEYDWQYKVADPQKIHIPDKYPDIDLVLTSKIQESLFLQLKQPLENERVKVIHLSTRSTLKSFKSRSIESTVKKAEAKYNKNGNNITNTILLLHMHKRLGYLPKNTTKEKMDTAFRGIYVISPKLDAYQNGKQKMLKEFVFEIKNAFN